MAVELTISYLREDPEVSALVSERVAAAAAAAATAAAAANAGTEKEEF